MNKTLTIFAVVCLMSLGLIGGSHAAASMAQGGVASCDVKDLLGAQVKDPAGEIVGSISDFVYDPHGRIALAILYQGAYEDFDVARFVAVPFSDLSISGMKPNEMTVVLNADKEKLDSAPRFDRARDAKDTTKWARIYRYFGQTPYWTEEPPLAAPATSSPEGGFQY